MSVQNNKVIDNVVNGSDIFHPCKHFEETLLMMRWVDVTGEKNELIPEHVMLVRPCCKSCLTPEELYEGVTVRHKPIEWSNGVSKRLVELFTPLDFYLKFCERSKNNPHPGEECKMEWNNRFGDLCAFCRTANTATVQHQGGARTEVFMDHIG